MVKKIAIIYSGSRFGGGVDTYYANLFKSYSKKDVELVIISLGKWPLLDKLDKNSYKVFSGHALTL
jgi:hypothetical protein